MLSFQHFAWLVRNFGWNAEQPGLSVVELWLSHVLVTVCFCASMNLLTSFHAVASEGPIITACGAFIAEANFDWLFF